MTIRAEFQGSLRPEWIEEFSVVPGEEETVVPRALRGASVHAFRHGFGPGRVGLRWGTARTEGCGRSGYANSTLSVSTTRAVRPGADWNPSRC